MRHNQNELLDHGHKLKSLFRRKFGSRSERELNHFVTALANEASSKAIRIGGNYCLTAQDVMAKALAAPRGGLSQASYELVDLESNGAVTDLTGEKMTAQAPPARRITPGPRHSARAANQPQSNRSEPPQEVVDPAPEPEIVETRPTIVYVFFTAVPHKKPPRPPEPEWKVFLAENMWLLILPFVILIAGLAYWMWRAGTFQKLQPSSLWRRIRRK